MQVFFFLFSRQVGVGLGVGMGVEGRGREIIDLEVTITGLHLGCGEVGRSPHLDKILPHL